MTKAAGRIQYELPAVIGVFPLPNTVLFPAVDLPLFVFEPRYRRMLADAREGSRMIAVSLMKKGWEKSPEPVPSADIAGIGYLRAVIERPDGNCHVMLRGLARVRITEYERLTPYRLARIRAYEEKKEDRPELVSLARKLRRLLRQKMSFQSENPGRRIRLPAACGDPEPLSYVAAHFSSCAPELKQELLELQSTSFRIKNLIGIYEEELYPPEANN